LHDDEVAAAGIIEDEVEKELHGRRPCLMSGGEDHAPVSGVFRRAAKRVSPELRLALCDAA
jgi:hypothetical protein